MTSAASPSSIEQTIDETRLVIDELGNVRLAEVVAELPNDIETIEPALEAQTRPGSPDSRNASKQRRGGLWEDTPGGCVMGQWLNNPLTYVLALAVGDLIVRGLFWLRDVHNAKEGWEAVLLLIQPSVTSGSPLKLTATGERMAESIQARQWAAQPAIRRVPVDPGDERRGGAVRLRIRCPLRARSVGATGRTSETNRSILNVYPPAPSISHRPTAVDTNVLLDVFLAQGSLKLPTLNSQV